MHFYVMEKIRDFFTLRPSDLNTTLTYVLMDNFCLCFNANNLCIPESFNTNILHQLFVNKITFVNLHDFLIKTRFKTFVLKISGTKIKQN